jgi:hypothetical protein
MRSYLSHGASSATVPDHHLAKIRTVAATINRHQHVRECALASALAPNQHDVDLAFRRPSYSISSAQASAAFFETGGCPNLRTCTQ